ncbi:hypothetical protein B0F90DRAFT_1949722 [Multifurca ochricompacta]|uniref:Transmembrane protein 242 n=1 Tax=Multifurca ochricompacta TaxID=376703 RepID=A0AAD4QPE1_9AGAM|nr:hypothetical protein B0F90DRAFT_1949722 [Multifurca ochricompacta]
MSSELDYSPSVRGPSDLRAQAHSPKPPPKDSQDHISPWIPISMLVVTTTALAVPLVLLRRQRAATVASIFSRSPSSSIPSGAPPVRRIPLRSVPSVVPPPRVAPVQTPMSPVGAPSLEAGSTFGMSFKDASSVSKEDGFNGALDSLKAFGIATALVMAGGAASVWGIKTYLGVKDTQEFASAMRLTLLTKWPLLTSRIHRTSDSAPLPTQPVSLPASVPTTSESDVRPPTAVVPDAEGWNWPASQARLAAAYERGGVAQFAEAAVGELEAEVEVERRRRGLANSPEGRS